MYEILVACSKELLKKEVSSLPLDDQFQYLTLIGKEEKKAFWKGKVDGGLKKSIDK